MWPARRLAKTLLLVGGFAALAALFAPAAPWGAVDLGATGAAVFMMSLAVAIWLFTVRGDSIFPDETSLAERRAWLGLVFVTVVLLSYTRQLWALSQGGQVPHGIEALFAHHFMQRLVTLVIAWSLLSYLLGRNAGIEADERDLRLQRRADRAGDWALTLIVIGCVVVLAVVPAARLAWWLSPIVLANVLIGLLIARSLVEHFALTLQYRAARA